MSAQPNAKPSLTGVKIKVRKGAAKAQAKHEPQVFRDQVYKYLETVTPGDFDGYTAKLITAGSTLEFSKYADALFEILLVGGLLQPGGTYIDDGAPVSPFSIFNAAEPPQIAEIKQYVDVFDKLIRRYKYLQKPLETVTLPSLLQYINRWVPAQKEKLALTIGVMMTQSIITATCLSALTKDHLTKDDVSANIITTVFRAYLASQTMDQLALNLKKSGIKDLLAFFPANKRNARTLDAHFRSAGMPQVADWFAKRQAAIAKEVVLRDLKEHLEAEDSNEQIIEFLKEQQADNVIPEIDLVAGIWQSITSVIDWDSARPDQIESFTAKEIAKYAPILEPFSQGSKTQIALINIVQVYCYENTKFMKAFTQILKVLYNADCVSDQGIIYWYQKGSKPDGRQHFLKAAEPLVKALQEQEDSDEEE
ncbi:ARM repeat-containing protein [Clavulina sp. PMI_390]|nr:ARM repeat-containing protein [Clavulina sp. PMI_390]